MSSIPPDDDDDDDDFLRGVAKVEDRAPPSPVARLEGTTIGRFRVISEIGRGGMGMVFLAEDDKLGRKVALKLLRPAFAADEARRVRFVREARATAAVSHPNLITVYDVGEDGGRAYLAMEYLDGQSLRDVLAERALTIDEALDFARQILAGLAHAHAAGLLHRDLKPENLLVTRSGRIKILDFGLAKIADDGESGSEHGIVMGTPGYMSPEQARGQAVDARSDVFSFGVVLHEMLTRERPFTGPTRADVVTSILRDEPVSADVARPEVGIALAEVVQKCLAKASRDRFTSCDEVIAALDAPRVERASIAPAPNATRGRGRIAIVIGAGALAIALWIAIRETRVHPPPLAAADAAPRAMAITDAPPPRSKSPEALTAYRQAMQAFRDADWAIAQERLGEAIARDPELGAAHLRLAIILSGTDDPPSSVRAVLGRAMSSRMSLSERDQGLLAAFEPIITRDPPERDVASKRFVELVHAHPDDAELWHLYAMFGAPPKDECIAAERHAVALDPQYADAWQILGAELMSKGNTDEALAALERCVAVSPLSADCRGELARIHGMLGQCAQMDEDLRRGLSSNPRGATLWQDNRAASLFAIGRSDDTVLEAFRQKWALLDADHRKLAEPYDRALLATARGRLPDADALLAAGETAIELDPNEQSHAKYTGARIAIAVERNQPKDAAKMASGFLARKDAWLGSSPMMDLEIPLLRVMLHGGMLAPDALAKRRDTWFARARGLDTGSPPIHFWSLAYAEQVETPAEAKTALDALPTWDPSQIVKDPSVLANLGWVLHLQDRSKEAVLHLERATRACNWLTWPVAHTQALLHLGQAREATGDRDGACVAYRTVATRWSSADRSVTRDAAKARVKALGCAD